jgi:hypothetical protein
MMSCFCACVCEQVDEMFDQAWEESKQAMAQGQTDWLHKEAESEDSLPVLTGSANWGPAPARTSCDWSVSLLSAAQANATRSNEW